MFEIGIILFAITTVLLFYTSYKWATRNNKYFKIRSMKHLPATLFGNTIGLYLRRYPAHVFMETIYQKYPDEKLIGFFDFQQPCYMTCDADIIAQIGITKFDHFVDRIPFVDTDVDVLFGKSLLLMSGNKWRTMRCRLTPAFTDSKLRRIFQSNVQIATNFIEHLIAKCNQDNSIQWEMKDLFSRYAADSTASFLFGLKVDSLDDPSNDFVVVGRDAADFTKLKTGLRLALVRTFPKLMSVFGIEFVPDRIKRPFESLMLNVFANRKKNKKFRPDMINILMKLWNEKSVHKRSDGSKVNKSNGISQAKCDWSSDELVAQCFFSYWAGFNTTATTMAFMAYECALNPDIQQKLYEEVRMVNASLAGDQLSFDTVSKLKYLDQVVNETLRRWTPSIFTNRVCTNDVEIDLDNRKLQIERGIGIWIPLITVHLDPKNFENPLKFDPERFNDQNKLKIKPGSFIPFGIGPRNCIAAKFVLFAIKTLFFHLLLNFEIQPNDQTQIPLEFANSVMNWKTECGIHLEFKLRPKK